MRKTSFAGHPLHPQLIVAPLGLLPFSFAMDVASHATGKRSFADAAYYSMVGGLVTGLLAGAAGAADYRTLPRGGQAKKTGATHGLMNVGLLGLYAVNAASRRRRRTPTAGQTALSGACAAGLLVSGWLGAQLVYKHGVRVRGRSPIEDVPEVELSGGRALEHGLETLERPLPQPTRQPAHAR